MKAPCLTSGIHDFVEERRVSGRRAIFSSVSDGDEKMAPLVSVAELSEAIFSDPFPTRSFDRPLSNRDRIMQKSIVGFGVEGVRTEPKADKRLSRFELNDPADVVCVGIAAENFEILFGNIECQPLETALDPAHARRRWPARREEKRTGIGVAEAC